ncbi:MAG TPA: twin-arginine translocase TatA/TatE family subunit [Solirubrobacteraceae bacterium]|jgi:sec-independent protein translocase protein TatA|nr:twin-arginine translocase TatA/TatE family subunit [Solirubrobacteraceae bacterium]
MFTSLLTPTHLVIVLIVALLFLGPKRLPEAGRSLGQGLKEFKKSIAANEEAHQLPGDAVPVPAAEERPLPQ